MYVKVFFFVHVLGVDVFLLELFCYMLLFCYVLILNVLDLVVVCCVFGLFCVVVCLHLICW